MKSYEIDLRLDGAGWRLRLLDDDEEMGGGVFAQDEYADAMAEGERWTARADVPPEVSPASAAEGGLIELIDAIWDIWAQRTPVWREVEELVLAAVQAQAMGAPLDTDHDEKCRRVLLRLRFIDSTQNEMIDAFSNGEKEQTKS